VLGAHKLMLPRIRATAKDVEGRMSIMSVDDSVLSANEDVRDCANSCASIGRYLAKSVVLSMDLLVEVDALLFILAIARGILNEAPDDEFVTDMLVLDVSTLLKVCSRLGMLVAAPADPSGNILAHGCSELDDDERLSDLGLSVLVLDDVK
jgi:hypothetical protein